MWIAQRFRRLSLSIVFVLAGIVLLERPSAGGTINISANVIGTVGDNSPQNGIGDFTLAARDAFVENPLPNLAQLRGILEFDISALTDPVNSVSLFLEKFDAQFGTRRLLSVYGRIGDGILSTSDYTLGSLLGSFFYDGEPFASFDATTFVNSLITGPAPHHYVEFQIVWPQGEHSSDFVEFSPALLFVSQTPLPATLPLFVTGVGIFGFAVSRRKKWKTSAAIA